MPQKYPADWAFSRYYEGATSTDWPLQNQRRIFESFDNA
jgi:hypothetical protein